MWGIMPYSSLTKENFALQIIKFGWIFDEIPPCFISNEIISHIDDLLALVGIKKPNKLKDFQPAILSIYKDDLSRRLLSLPNLEIYFELIKYMKSKWDEIKESANSTHSLSPITYIHKYDTGATENINVANVKDFLKSKSDIIDGIKECIRLSLGYKYRMCIDISNFYDTIYTHSIPWAILGKKIAKEYFKTKTPLTARDGYELGDNLDILTRKQKNNETNGLVVGPFSSRIISEIILAGIDKELDNHRFVFKRYVDDYKFYFKTENEANESIFIIQKVLNEFNLNINTSKTKIEKYPYEVVSTISTALQQAYREDGIFGVLNTASYLYLNGNKGSFKYALKYISNHTVNINQADDILSLLVNIMLIEPKHGKYITNFLLHNKSIFDLGKLTYILNNELGKSLTLGLDQEALWFTYLLRELDLDILAENVILALGHENDFITIIMLDIYRYRNHRVKRNRSQAAKINNLIDNLANMLKSESYQGNHWLLLYVADILKLINSTHYVPVTKTNFWNEMYNKKINLFCSVKP